MQNRSMTVALLALLVAGCSRTEIPQPASSATTSPPIAPQNSQSEGVSAPTEEPTNDVVRDLIFEEYREIEQAGGMPVTVTGTGQGIRLRAKLFHAQKEKCTHSPQDPPGSYDCDLLIKVSMTGDGSDPANEEPSEQGERIGVKWDPSGKWIRR